MHLANQRHGFIKLYGLTLGIAIGFTESLFAANFWLSTSNDVTTGSQPPASVAGIPQIARGFNGSGSFFIWAKPDPGETLLNWSLNVVSSNPNVLSLMSANVSTYNPILNAQNNARRWEFVGEPTTTSSAPGNEVLERVLGFSLQLDPANVGLGIGSGLTAAEADPFAANDSWLIAKIDYVTKNNLGSTDVFLQIGDAGINHSNEPSSMTDVFLGAISDQPLNGATQRNQSSTTPELTISVSDILESSADFDGDSDVDGRDFLLWQRGFGSSSGLGDANGDSTTNGDDLAIWEQQYGTTESTIPTFEGVPEPSTLMLLSLAVILCYAKRLPY